ncbi:MAG: PUA domain-containing protein [Desulfurococcaceae archaeon]
MIIRKPTSEELEELRYIAKLQFGVNAEIFLPNDLTVAISPNTNKIRLIFRNGNRYLALRSRDFRFNLYIEAGKVLNEILPHPLYRVYVKDEYVDFIARGATLFSKHVLMADPRIRPDDEVIVADSHGNLLAVGRAVEPGWEMTFYKRGVAVKIREGIYQ